MSGYFDALMRASGITIGVAAADTGRSMPRSDRTGIESAQGPNDLSAVRSAQTACHETVAPMRASSEPSAEDGFANAAAEVIALESRASQEERGPMAAAAHGDSTGQRPTPPEQPGTTPSRDLATTPDVRLQTALRWVAGGPTTAEQPDPRRSTSKPRESLQDAASGSSLTREHHDIGIASESADVDAARAVHAEESAREPLGARARAVANDPLERGLPTLANEALEISIGAIHVSIDAPPAQTIARPVSAPVAPAERTSAANRVPPSSRLARRALRRI